MKFELDPRFDAETFFIADWPLCQVRLMDDARYFWLVLVPRRMKADGGPVTEITDLAPADRTLLIEEVARAAAIVKGRGKINLGTLGIVVPQMHWHVLTRHPGDPAWPGPVWGHSPRIPHDDSAKAARIALVQRPS